MRVILHIVGNCVDAYFDITVQYVQHPHKIHRKIRQIGQPYHNDL